MEEQLDIVNKIVKQAFIMHNYMFIYNSATEHALSILIPEKKRNGEGEMDYKPEVPKSP
jgi:hypothetical protein